MTVASYGEIMGVFSSNTQPLKYTSSVNFNVAGAECNTLIGLSKLGINTTLLTAVGEDSVGNAILQKLASERINLNYVHQLAHNNTGIMLKEKGIGSKINIDYFRKNSAVNSLDIDPFLKHLLKTLPCLT
ncbi:PfkB family carbohydrate kinase [Staphylococcus equorum]